MINLRKTSHVALALAALAIGLSGAPASAQNINAFKVTTVDSTMVFNVNGHDMNIAGSAALGSYLNQGAGSQNTVNAGFTAPPSMTNFIVLAYEGTGTTNWGNVQLAHGDVLKVFGISGVYLENPGGVSANLAGSTIYNYTPPGGNTASWNSASLNGQVQGYAWGSGYPNSGNWLAMNNTGTFDGKDLSNKAEYGAFLFNNLSLGSGTTFLGMDVIADVYASDGTTLLASGAGNTGHVQITSVSSSTPGSVVPEGSSLALVGGGLLPLAGLVRFTRRKRTATTSAT